MKILVIRTPRSIVEEITRLYHATLLLLDGLTTIKLKRLQKCAVKNMACSTRIADFPYQ